MLNFFKKKTNKVVPETIPQQEETESLDIHFDYKTLPKEKRNEKIYLANWLKNDGDSVEKGHPLYRIQIGERLGVGMAFKSQPLKAEKSGIVQFLKKEGEEIHDNSPIYTLHPKGKYDSENTPLKKSYSFYFDKFKYDIPKNYAHHSLKIKKWHKEDGDNIPLDEKVISPATMFNSDKLITIYEK